MRGGAALGSARNGQTDRHQPISSILSCPLGPVMNVDDTFINNNNMQRGGSQILYFFKSILTTPDRQTNRLTYRSASETIKYKLSIDIFTNVHESCLNSVYC